MPLNAVTNTATGQVLRVGWTDFENDGTFDAGTETYHEAVGALIIGILRKYLKIVGGVLTEMTQGEKDAIDAAEPPQLFSFLVPSGTQEQINSGGAINLTGYTTDLSGNDSYTFADGQVTGQAKLIQTQSGANVTITCSLIAPSVSFSLGANNKALLQWHTADSVWHIIDEKGLTLNT